MHALTMNHCGSAAIAAMSSVRGLLPPLTQVIKNVSKVALPVIALMSISSVPQAEAGIFSGLAVAAACVGAGIVFPGNLFFAAAPCYEAAMWATVNPVIP